MSLRVDIDATPLIGKPTGVGMFVRGLMSALSQRDDVDLGVYALTLRGAGQLAAAVPDGMRHPRLPMPAGPLTRVWSRFDWPAAETWTGRTDIVHGMNFVVPPTRRAAAVVTVHDLTAIRFPEMCEPATLAYPRLVKVAVERGAHVHTLSQFVANEVVEQLDIDAKQVHVVNPGVPPITASNGVSTIARFGVSPEQYILAIGTVEPRKDYPGLVRAFDVLASERPQLQLVIAGTEGWASSQLTEAVRKARHGDRVVRAGYVDESTRNSLLRNAAVLAYPSVYEGFGLPPLEAMRAGVPVVATSAGAVPEVVGSAASVVPVGNDTALAKAIGTVLDDPNERARLIAAGRERVGDFSWERCADEMIQLYELLTAEGRA